MTHDQLENQTQSNKITLFPDKLRFYLTWVFVNSCILAIGFFVLSSWDELSQRHTRMVFGLPGILIVNIVLGIAQAFLLRRLLSQRKRIGWVIATVIGTEIASLLRNLAFFLLAMADMNGPVDPTSILGRYLYNYSGTVWRSYLLHLYPSLIGGVIGGVIMGLIQVICTPLNPLWILVNAVAWALAYPTAWLVSRVIANSWPFQPETTFLTLLQMMSYGLVMGLVSSAISGLGLLTCFSPSRSTSRKALP